MQCYLFIYLDYTRAVAVDAQGLSTVIKFISWACDVTEQTLAHEKVQQLMWSNETFDLFLYEVFVNDGLLGLAQHFKVPTVGFSTLGTTRWVQEYTGSPLPDSYLPHLLLGFSDRMTITQRLINGIANAYEEVMLQVIFYPLMGRIYNRYIADPKPSFREVRKSAVSLVLLNHHISLSGAKPLMSNVIEAGGMHLKSDLNPLPPDLQQFLDDAHEGVVYFSLGSNLNATHMGEKAHAISSVLSKIPQKVIWKWGNSSDLDPKKFYSSTWLPQNEILAHKNVKLFITHGGLLSITEAINCGVPFVGFAMFADQRMNMVRAQESGYGLLLDYSNLTETSLSWAVTEILTDKKYENMAKLTSKRFKDRPQNGLETAKFWIEYVIRNKGADFLRSSAMDLNLIQYYNLDVITLLALIVFIVVKLVRIMIKLARKVLKKEAIKEKTS